MKNLQRITAGILVILQICIYPFVFADETITGLENFTVRSGNPSSRKIAITMDDCTHLDVVWKTANLCQQYGITMTFFPNGCNLHLSDREQWQRVLDAGCEIGSHGEYHQIMNTSDRITDGLMLFQQHLDEMLGYHYQVRWFRPPYGAIEDSNGGIAYPRLWIMKCGYDHALLWNVSYMKDAEGAFTRAKNGSVFLFHATDSDYRCLNDLIPMLLEAGYIPVTVSELFGLDPPETSEEIYFYDRKTFTYPRPNI